jgi:hypothetical protein
MPDSVLVNLPKNASGTTNHPEDPSREQFLIELGRLARRWKALDEDDLALRHETGVALNRFFGGPTTRQARGKGVMKEAAAQLGKTEAELSQLRRFASVFSSVDALRAQHPEAANWTRVRQLLSELPRGGGKGRVSTRKAVAARLRKVIQPLRRVTSAFAGLGNEISAKEKARLVQVLQKFVAAVPDCLRVKLVID